MSLNGLDDAKVKEAHETAAAEPGGATKPAEVASGSLRDRLGHSW
jgi:hypothetical protein